MTIRLIVLAAGAALAIGGCAGRAAIVQDRPVRVAVPVPQPCAATRPGRVIALKDTVPDWYQRDARQKAALVGKQLLDRQTYSEQLEAATAACP